MTIFVKTNHNILAEPRANQPTNFIALPCNGMLRKDNSLVIGNKPLKQLYPNIEKDMGSWIRRTGVREQNYPLPGTFYRYHFTIHPDYPQIMLLQTKFHWQLPSNVPLLKVATQKMLAATRGLHNEIHLAYPHDDAPRSLLYPILSALPDNVFVWYRYGYC